VTAEDVLAVLDALAAAGVDAVLDGGWGIDALVGEQTRPHGDADMAIERARLGDAEAALAGLGYRRVPDAVPGLPARAVLRAEDGRQVDLHLLVLTPGGDGWQQLDDADTWGCYPAAERTTGRIAGRVVPCISARLQLAFHQGWTWDAKARGDLDLLSERRGTPSLPAPPAGAG
jgi:lincosamide nucleotidyltransferase A/C/D/E